MVMKPAKVRWSKTLKGKMPTNAYLMAKVGQRAFDMIRDRITKTGMLHTGQKLPKYSDGWAIVPLNDQRFSGGELSRLVMTDKGPRFVDGKEPVSRIFRGGYAEAKASAGGGRHSDGDLTGDMWDNGRVTLGIRKKHGVVIAIGFIGSSVVTTTKIAHSTNIKTRQVKYRTKRVRITNQKKADALQRRKADGTRTKVPQFELMGLTDREFAIIARAYLDGIQLLSP